MSAASGISASQELIDEYTKVVDDAGIRFLKIGIQNASLVPDGTWPKSNPTFEADLPKLQEILADKTPAYILARLDSDAEWLLISYVPNNAGVSDKFQYASSRAAVTKALGGQFKDNIFATSKEDLSPNAYKLHLKSINAPQPMSAREAELAEIQAAERQTGVALEGSRARRNHVGAGVGLGWTQEAQNAIKDMVSDDGNNLVILAIDPESENIRLVESTSTALDGVPAALPTTEPSYSFFKWHPSKIVFTYACPSSSQVKLRMIYSSAKSGVIAKAEETAGFKVFKRLETSDPADLDLSFEHDEQQPASTAQGPPAFARPRGPPRRR